MVDCLLRKVEASRDLTVAHFLAEQPEYLHLARRQPAGVLLRRGTRPTRHASSAALTEEARCDRGGWSRIKCLEDGESAPLILFWSSRAERNRSLILAAELCPRGRCAGRVAGEFQGIRIHRFAGLRVMDSAAPSPRRELAQRRYSAIAHRQLHGTIGCSAGHVGGIFAALEPCDLG